MNQYQFEATAKKYLNDIYGHINLSPYSDKQKVDPRTLGSTISKNFSKFFYSQKLQNRYATRILSRPRTMQIGPSNETSTSSYKFFLPSLAKRIRKFLSMFQIFPRAVTDLSINLLPGVRKTCIVVVFFFSKYSSSKTSRF